MRHKLCPGCITNDDVRHERYDPALLHNLYVTSSIKLLLTLTYFSKIIKSSIPLFNQLRQERLIFKLSCHHTGTGYLTEKYISH